MVFLYLATGKMKASFCRLYDSNIGFLLKENIQLLENSTFVHTFSTTASVGFLFDVMNKKIGFADCGVKLSIIYVIIEKSIVANETV